MIRVVIADDHEVVRQGLRTLLRRAPGVEVVGEAANGRDAVAQTVRLRPDVLVIDVNMPELNGLEATRQVVKAAPETEVLALTMLDSEEMMLQVLRAGARGYVLKSDSGEQLVEAVEAVSAHRPWFTARLSEAMRATLFAPPGPAQPQTVSAALTPREREVLQLLAEGRTNKQVGLALGIGVKTVETHRMKVMAKLDLHSVVDLVRYAIRNGIVSS